MVWHIGGERPTHFLEFPHDRSSAFALWPSVCCMCMCAWAWLIIWAFKLSLSLWGIKCPHPCPQTFREQMILVNGVRMEGMCLCSLFCPHSEKPNLTNPLIKISFSHQPISLPVLIRHWCLSRPSLFAHSIDQVKVEVKLGQALWMSCNKWWISFAEAFLLRPDTWGMAITVNIASAACRGRVRLPSHQLQ